MSDTTIALIVIILLPIGMIGGWIFGRSLAEIRHVRSLDAHEAVDYYIDRYLERKARRRRRARLWNGFRSRIWR
jgi:hypothetical protein